jgi:hypothetical protein
MEAAIPAGCYNDSVNSYARFMIAEATRPTPDTREEKGYRLYLQSVTRNVGKFVSFFNIDDYALVTGTTRILFWPFETNWEKNQIDYKPDGGYFYRGGGISTCGPFRVVADAHESLAFVARPRSKAAGAELHNASVFGTVFNLESACGFGADVDDHSGQFTRPIQQLRPFYSRMVEEMKQ